MSSEIRNIQQYRLYQTMTTYWTWVNDRFYLEKNKFLKDTKIFPSSLRRKKNLSQELKTPYLLFGKEHGLSWWHHIYTQLGAGKTKEAFALWHIIHFNLQRAPGQF